LFTDWAPTDLLVATFTIPVGAVQIDFVADDSLDAGLLSVFDAANNLLATIPTGPILGTGTVFTASFDAPFDNIARIQAAGAGAIVVIDNLRFTDDAVPEPASLGLLGLGLGALGWSRRKNKS
jgi:PEP-CTERM motif